jgi:putative FmdB family regulatory protein
MPLYEYACNNCEKSFEVVKRMSELERETYGSQECPSCGLTNTYRMISRTHFYGASDWDKAEYNPGLGCITKNSRHRDRIAKA